MEQGTIYMLGKQEEISPNYTIRRFNVIGAVMYSKDGQASGTLQENPPLLLRR